MQQPGVLRAGTGEGEQETATGQQQDEEDDGERNTPEQDAVIQLAKEAQKKGLTPEQAEILKAWAEEYNVPNRPQNRLSETHPNRPQGKYPHIHVGPVDHIPVQ